MPNRKSSIALLLGTVLALAGIAQVRADDNLLQTIKERGVLRVCDVPYAPWNMKNPADNTWEGASVDILKIIAKDLNVKLQHVDATWATVIPSLETKKCDFSGSGLYVSPARAQIVSFTRSIAQDGISIFVPDGSTAKTFADIDKPGKTVIARSGSFEEAFMKKTLKHATLKTLTTDGAGLVLLEVAAGRADYAAGGYYGNLAFLKANPNVKVRVLSDKLLTRTSIAYAVPAKQYFFRDFLNVVLNTLDENGTLKQIIDKWTH